MKPMLKAAVMVMMLAFASAAAGQGREDVQRHKECAYCGMDRGSFDFSRMLIEYDDGTSVGACSIRCAAVDLAVNLGKTPKLIMVGDFGSKDLIDAEKAFWVIGGSRPGVMTRRGKWAFAKKEDAEEFMKSNGGTVVSFDDAMKAAYEDLHADTKMIREKRRARMLKEGGHRHH